MTFKTSSAFPMSFQNFLVFQTKKEDPLKNHDLVDNLKTSTVQLDRDYADITQPRHIFFYCKETQIT